MKREHIIEKKSLFKSMFMAKNIQVKYQQNNQKENTPSKQVSDIFGFGSSYKFYNSSQINKN